MPATARIAAVVLFSAAVFIVYVWLAGVITDVLMFFAQRSGHVIGDFIVAKGSGRVLRRVLMISGVLLLFSVVKKMGWRGWRDCGWTAPDGGVTTPWTRFIQGALIGVATIGILAASSVAAGTHRWTLETVTTAAVAGGAAAAVFSGLLVALLEETVCRGILFRVFWRAWNAPAAAVFTSLLFAAAHFIGSDDLPARGDSFLATSLKTASATLQSIVPPPGSQMRFLNLFLMGLALCGFTARTRTIWMGAGAHAAWVAIISLHSRFTELNAAAPFSAWLGKRNDFMDAPAASALFLALIALSALRPRPAGTALELGGRLWRAVEDRSWAPEGLLRGGESFFDSGTVLKSYSGCRIALRDGLVLKQRWPNNLFDRARSAFRPPRGKRVFRTARELAALGVPTPRILAWTAARRLGFLVSEAHIAEELAGAEQLTAWLERGAADRAALGKVMESYGALAASLHRLGYSNRDLKHENVMCSRAEPWRLWMVDLDGVWKCLFVSRRRAGRDLMRVGRSLSSLGLSGREETMRFFTSYNRIVPRRLRRGEFPL